MPQWHVATEMSFQMMSLPFKKVFSVIVYRCTLELGKPRLAIRKTSSKGDFQRGLFKSSSKVFQVEQNDQN